MDESLQELKLILRELILEVGDLKERVTRLEMEKGREEVLRPQEHPAAYSVELEGESYENLGRIYQQGYHVCHPVFGQVRQEECLFCLAFLEKE